MGMGDKETLACLIRNILNTTSDVAKTANDVIYLQGAPVMVGP